jgi:adenylate cyclase class 2
MEGILEFSDVTEPKGSGMLGESSAQANRKCRPMYEVELKFPLPDPVPVVRKLLHWGARQEAAVDQCDVYYRHPVRDFEQTDEALRVRSVGTEHRVTYKGPVVDSRTKTRREIEVPFGAPDAGARFGEILVALGFQPVRAVRKRRTTYHLDRDGRALEIAVDNVAGLGDFLEIEALAEESEKDGARDAILAVAAELGLANAERKSYLALLLARDGEKK